MLRIHCFDIVNEFNQGLTQLNLAMKAHNGFSW